MSEAVRDFWHERSAIREFDGGAPREEAEALSLGEVAVRYGWPAAVGLSQLTKDEE